MENKILMQNNDLDYGNLLNSQDNILDEIEESLEEDKHLDYIYNKLLYNLDIKNLKLNILKIGG